jgi:UPF0755 protein
MAKKKKKAGRTALKVLLALVIIGIACAGALYFGIKNYNNAYKPGSDEKIVIDIEAGSGTTKIAQELEKAGVINSANIFKFKTKFCKLDGKYQAGHYTLSPSMTMEEIMEILQFGKLVEVSFTVPEGLTLNQVAEKLAADGIVNSADEFMLALEDVYDYEFLKDIKGNEIKDPDTGVVRITAKANRLEGYLFPETYRVFSGSDPHTVINTMLSYFNTHVYEKLKSQVPNGYSFHEMVTLASMIEEECGAEKDRRTISGVFWNRLNLPMRLQSDVTIHYILGNDKFDKNLDSPYNTYKVNGLPAGPICSPGYSSIEAALKPEQHNYYYFVLKGDKSGECNFAETYEEHLKNVEIYNNSEFNY